MRRKTVTFALFAGLLLGMSLAPLLSRAKPAMIPATFADIAEKVRPSVVNISSVRIINSPFNNYNQFNDPLMQEFFQHFFGPNWSLQQQQPQKSVSLGSGVIVDSKGYILTNYHVIDKANEIIVKVKDGKEYQAVVVGSDPKTDLAVIRLKHKAHWVAADLGDSDQVRVGDWVLALGSPFGLEQTVTSGIISAKSRTIGQGPYDNFLQTDASINPGNSGGPLVNLDGQVIGINTAIVSQSGGSIGIGFAIPINMAKKIYQDLISTGMVRRGWLGVNIQNLTPALSSHFKLPANTRGVLINAVFRGGPADRAGIKPGDILVTFKGHHIATDKDLLRLVAQTSEGEKITVTIFHDGAVRKLKVKMGDLEKAQRARNTSRQAPAARTIPESNSALLGLEVEDRPADQKGGHSGVVIVSVEPGSPAEGAGLLPGDAIREVNRQQVNNAKTFNTLVDRLKPSDDLLILLERHDYTIYVAMKIPRP